MQIISKFHDFYDRGMGLGYADDDIRFIRTQRPVDGQNWPELNNFPYDFASPRYRLEPFSIGFCGKIYNGIRLIEYPTGWPYPTFKIYYDSTSIYNYLINNYKKYFDVEKFVKAQYPWQKQCSAKVFLDCSSLSNSFSLRCIEQCVSILVHTSWELDDARYTENRPLHDLEFYRIFNPYTAYQELSMWIGGNLIKPDKPMIQISDKDKIHKRGFNLWSFRKEPKT